MNRATIRAVDRQAMAVVALAVLGRPDALRPAFRHQADPRLRTGTIQKIATLKLAPRGAPRASALARARRRLRQAVLLTWAETPLDGILPAIRAGVLKNARQSFFDDRDPGVHSAAELLIRRWKPGRRRCPRRQAKLPGRAPAGRSAATRDPTGTPVAFLRGPLVSAWGPPRAESRSDIPTKRDTRRRIATFAPGRHDRDHRQAVPRISSTTTSPTTRYCDKGWLAPRPTPSGGIVGRGHPATATG